ncbi:MAG: helix-turn-helix transcriptional regulator [Candidatus Limnocylindrales bacterium]
MHASRLVSVLLLLQARGRLTARQLAVELEVSLRTIYRDLDELAAAGIPLYADRGRAGGYQLVDGYRTRLTGLSAEEAQALFLSGLGGAAAQLGLGTVLAAAQLKVLAALPPELRGRAARIQERFLLVAPGWFRADEQPEELATVAQAVWEARRLEIVYRRPAGPTTRRIEPLGLVLKGGVWYVVARRAGDLRTYRASRIERASLLEEHFERPEGFDLAAQWEASELAFEASLRRQAVRVHIQAGALPDLDYALGGSRRLGTTLVALPAADPDEWLDVTFSTDSLESAHDDLLRLGDRVEVLAPRELRRELAATAGRMAARYAVRTAAGASSASDHRRGASRPR